EERKLTKCPELCQMLEDGGALHLELWLGQKAEEILVTQDPRLAHPEPSTCLCFVLDHREGRAYVQEPTVDSWGSCRGTKSTQLQSEPPALEVPAAM
ncbi:hypothetical protein P7K49_021021, partial [Saguinus oedipus]